MSLRYSADGYVDDNEKIDGDALLDAIKQGTEEGNKDRLARGLPTAAGGSRTEARSAAV